MELRNMVIVPMNYKWEMSPSKLN